MKRLQAFGKIVMGILRELSDQTAYQRHLDMHGRVHSGNEWRHFLKHRLEAKYTRPKCC
jgi:hypothetical protein